MEEAVILCVDDEEIVLRSLRRELYQALGDDYIIETAETGEDALEVLQKLLEEQYEVPVVIADHIMPAMKGDELLQHIHAFAPKTLKIMLTGQADIQAVINAVNNANLYRYIAKPWEKTDLCLTVKEAIHSYFQEKKLEEQHEALQKLYAHAQQEITKRKHVEEALRKSEASIRAVVETAADGIITFDQEGIIESFNPAAEKMFGYHAKEIIGQNIKTLLPSSPNTVYDRSQNNPGVFNKEITACICSEITGRRKNGTMFPIDITVSEVPTSNHRRFTGFIHEITERKRAERERLQLAAIQHELKIAHDIQQSLLPKPRPKWPQWDVICYNAPALEIGGDFYSYHAFAPSLHSFKRDNKEKQRFALAIGDVSGKGVSAALLMATILPQLDTAFSFDFTPAECLAYLDEAIVPYTRQQNCALCYVELDLTEIDYQAFRNRRVDLPLRVVNAGGIPPYIKRKDGAVEWLDIGGMPLGLGIGAKTGYQEIQVNLSAGDMVILTSDGVAEANASTNDMFGFERLEAAIRTAPTTNAETMLEHLKAELAAFVRDAEAYDDITIIVLQV